MRTEINDAFLIEYVDGILTTISQLHKELRENDMQFDRDLLFGLRTALFQLQNQIILWHPNIDEQDCLLDHFHLNFEIETLLNINAKVPYVE